MNDLIDRDLLIHIFNENKTPDDRRNEFIDSAINLIKHQNAVSAIPIPDNATNGDMIKALFPCEDLEEDFDSEWWRSPYKRGDTE